MTSEGLLTKQRHVWTDKAGNKLTFKQFMSRWKEGMQNVTPLQQLKAQLPSFVLILVGVILGLIVSFVNGTWWLFIVLIGVLGINAFSFLGTWQKYRMLKKLDEEIREAQVQVQKAAKEVANEETK